MHIQHLGKIDVIVNSREMYLGTQHIENEKYSHNVYILYILLYLI